MCRYLILMLMLVAAPTWAEWEKYGIAEPVTFYHDPATIKKNGSLHRFWSIQDLKVRGKFGELSRLVLNEFDCKAGLYRALAVRAHAENMGRGTLLGSADSPGEWNHVAPGTIADTGMKIACAQ